MSLAERLPRAVQRISGEPRILIYDIETAPSLAYTFQTRKAYISPAQLVEPGRMLSFAARWYGQEGIAFFSEYHHSRERMLLELHDRLHEADVVVTYNGKRFDNRVSAAEFASEGLAPPSPWQDIDLFQVARARFDFPSLKLDYVAERILGERKLGHAGFALWAACMDPEHPQHDLAWRQMRAYNVQDVRVTTSLYTALRPWQRNGPSLAVMAGRTGCPRCGSTDYLPDGLAFTQVSRFERFQCSNCGAWLRTGATQARSRLRAAI